MCTSDGVVTSFRLYELLFMGQYLDLWVGSREPEGWSVVISGFGVTPVAGLEASC